MSKQRTLPDILSELISHTIFLIQYQLATDNGDGTFTLSGICDIRYTQPGAPVTIDGVEFIISDYEKVNGDWNIILKANSNQLPVFPNTFQLYNVFFIHGTPRKIEAEESKLGLIVKTPMIYLMEPYDQEEDYTFDSAIDRRPTVTICFLTQADLRADWSTELVHHNSVNPMYALAQDFISLLELSNLFYTVRQKANVIFHTKFGINIRAEGYKELIWSENFAGVSLTLKLEIYKEEECCGTAISEKTYAFIDNEINVSSKAVNPLYAASPDNLHDPVLIGVIDGANRIFTVPNGNYRAGTMQVYVDGNFQRNFVETDNMTGVFTLGFDLQTYNIITVKYQGV